MKEDEGSIRSDQDFSFEDIENPLLNKQMPVDWKTISEEYIDFLFGKQCDFFSTGGHHYDIIFQKEILVKYLAWHREITALQGNLHVFQYTEGKTYQLFNTSLKTEFDFQDVFCLLTNAMKIPPPSVYPQGLQVPQHRPLRFIQGQIVISYDEDELLKQFSNYHQILKQKYKSYNLKFSSFEQLNKDFLQSVEFTTQQINRIAQFILPYIILNDVTENVIHKYKDKIIQIQKQQEEQLINDYEVKDANINSSSQEQIDNQVIDVGYLIPLNLTNHTQIIPDFVLSARIISVQKIQQKQFYRINNNKRPSLSSQSQQAQQAFNQQQPQDIQYPDLIPNQNEIYPYYAAYCPLYNMHVESKLQTDVQIQEQFGRYQIPNKHHIYPPYTQQFPYINNKGHLPENKNDNDSLLVSDDKEKNSLVEQEVKNSQQQQQQKPQQSQNSISDQISLQTNQTKYIHNISQLVPIYHIHIDGVHSIKMAYILARQMQSVNSLWLHSSFVNYHLRPRRNKKQQQQAKQQTEYSTKSELLTLNKDKQNEEGAFSHNNQMLLNQIHPIHIKSNIQQNNCILNQIKQIDDIYEDESQIQTNNQSSHIIRGRSNEQRTQKQRNNSQSNSQSSSNSSNDEDNNQYSYNPFPSLTFLDSFADQQTFSDIPSDASNIYQDSNIPIHKQYHQQGPNVFENLSQSILGTQQQRAQVVQMAVSQQKDCTDLGTEEYARQMGFVCPISRLIMKSPVRASDGQAYEREMIQNVLSRPNPYSPINRKPLKQELLPDYNLKNMIKEYLARFPDHILNPN